MARIDLDIDIISEGNFEETSDDITQLARSLDKLQDAANEAGDDFRELDDDVGTTSGGLRGKLGGALGSVQGKLSDMAGEVPIVGSALSGLAAGPVGLAITAVAGLAVGLGTLINQQKNAAVEIGNLSRTLGITTDDVQALRQAEKDLSIEADSLTDAQYNLNERLGEFSVTGGGPAEAALDSLSLSMYTLGELTPEEQLQQVILSLSRVEDVAERTRLGNELLGGSYEKLAPLLTLSKDEQDALWESSERGIGISEEQIERYEEIDLKIQQFKSGIQTLISQGTGRLVEALFDIGERLRPLIEEYLPPLIAEIRNLWEEVDEYVIPTLIFLGKVLGGALGIAFRLFVTYLRAVIAVVGFVVDGVKGLISFIEDLVEGFRTVTDAIGDFIDRARSIGDSVGSVVSLIPGLADGGIVPSTPGGRLVRVAEGGESEAIIPLSQIQSLADSAPTNVSVELNIGSERFMDVFVDTFQAAKERGLVE